MALVTVKRTRIETAIADAGLSAVHVNRVLQELRREGFVEVQRGRFRILERAKLEAFGSFEDGYLHLKPTS